MCGQLKFDPLEFLMPLSFIYFPWGLSLYLFSGLLPWVVSLEFVLSCFYVFLRSFPLFLFCRPFRVFSSLGRLQDFLLKPFLFFRDLSMYLFSALFAGPFPVIFSSLVIPTAPEPSITRQNAEIDQRPLQSLSKAVRQPVKSF